MSWPTVKLDTIRAGGRYSFVGGPFGSKLTTRDYVHEGVPVIRGNNLPEGRLFHDDDFVFVTEEKAQDLIANMAYPGDVIFTQRGTLGQVGIIPLDAKFPCYVVSQSQMKLSTDPDVALASFVYYFFRMAGTVQSMINHALTSGVPHINLGILKNFDIPLPPMRVQGRIVEILTAYDDLIENNRRRVALLAAAARQLYLEWFVLLRFPGYEHAAVVKGLPESWERVAFESAAVLQRGFDLPFQAREEGDIPIYGSTGINGFHSKARVSGPGVVTGRSGTLGEVHYVHGDYWPLNTVLWVKEFRRVTPLFLLFLMRSMDLRQYNGGVSVPTLDRKVVHRVEVLIPPRRLMLPFEDFAGPIFQQIRNLEAQVERLRAARDLLLPRLMSGEIPV